MNVNGSGNVTQQGSGSQTVGNITVAGKNATQGTSSGRARRRTTLVGGALTLLAAIVWFASSDVGQLMLRKMLHLEPEPAAAVQKQPVGSRKK
jgi:hypothetical protein